MKHHMKECSSTKGNHNAIPTWLTKVCCLTTLGPGPVLLKNYNRVSKYDLLVKKVNLLHANPDYSTSKALR